MTISAKQLLALLADRHTKDVFFAEVKDGPTWGGTHRRLDAWAMKRSWAQPCIYGYEIKVNRSDFISDSKWPGYLPLCNEFYFVCPAGLIDPREVGEGAGLIWMTKTGRSLRTKLKAPRREPDRELLEDLLRYLLMSRVTPVAAHVEAGQQSSLEYWTQWLAEKKESRYIGHQVASALRERIVKAEATNDVLRLENNKLAEIKSRLGELGIDTSTIAGDWTLSRKIDLALGELPPELGHNVDRAIVGLEEFRAVLKKYSKESL